MERTIFSGPAGPDGPPGPVVALDELLDTSGVTPLSGDIIAWQPAGFGPATWVSHQLPPAIGDVGAPNGNFGCVLHMSSWDGGTPNRPSFVWLPPAGLMSQGGGDYGAADAATQTFLSDAALGATIVTLPTASPGRAMTVKKIDATANTVTITPQSGTIDGDATLVLVSRNQVARLQSDGTNWWVV